MSRSAPAAMMPNADGEYTHRQIMTILTGLMMGMFLAALDQTIVSTAIRTIGDDLNGLSVQAWVTTAYLVSSTIMTPIYGKLGDTYGRKPLFMSAITIFIVGSALCAFSTSMYMLAVFRAIQGIGAGGLMTLVIAILGDIVAPRERAKYTGYMMAVFASSSVVGPVIGGLFSEADSILGVAGWRWVFLVNVPLGIAALAVVMRTLHLGHTSRSAKIDWRGAAALVICLVPMLTALEQGRKWGWGSPLTLSFFAVALVGVALFIAAEAKMGKDALIPLRIFTVRAAAVPVAAGVVVGMAMFGGMMVLPLYMQIVHGASPMRAGLMMLPMVLGMMAGSVLSGNVTAKTGKIRPFPIVGSVIFSVSLLVLSLVTADSSLVWVMAIMAALGFGLGNCMQPIMLIIQNAVPPQEIGVATAAATFFRQIGGTVGVAVFLSVLFSTVGGNITSEFEQAATDQGFQQAITDPQILQNPANRAVAETLTGESEGSLIAEVQDDSSILLEMDDVVAYPFKAGFAESMSRVFFGAGLVGFVAFFILILLPPVTLRTQSARAAALAEAAKGSASDQT